MKSDTDTAATHGWIWLRQVRLDARIGVYEHEERHAQPIEIDLGMWVNTARAAASDALSDTADWAGVYRTLTRVVHDRHFCLVETLCEALAMAVLEKYAARRVHVEVRKVTCLPSGTAAVAIERCR